MSELAPKLEVQPAQAPGTKARAKLYQLLQRRYVHVNGDWVLVGAMEDVEVWRRVSGRGGEAVYEKTEG